MNEGGMVSLEKRRLEGNMKAVCKHLKAGQLKAELDSSVCPRSRIKSQERSDKEAH